jgi:hypothetical protein
LSLREVAVAVEELIRLVVVVLEAIKQQHRLH